MFQKLENWVPHELRERDIAKRLAICELLLQKQKWKSFLHQIVIGDEKWIRYDNLKRKKSWVRPDESPTPKHIYNIHGKKVMLCIWWDRCSVL